MKLNLKYRHIIFNRSLEKNCSFLENIQFIKLYIFYLLYYSPMPIVRTTNGNILYVSALCVVLSVNSFVTRDLNLKLKNFKANDLNNI
jgi:hypothetical protein